MDSTRRPLLRCGGGRSRCGRLWYGVGRAVRQAMERWAVAAGLTGLRLESTRTALPFYERHGFKASGPATTFAGMEGQPMSKRRSRDAGAGRRLKLLDRK